MTSLSSLNLNKKISGQFKYRLPAVVGITVLLVLPSDGLGISVCWFEMLFNMSCPACGLTRGMSSLLHIEFYKSLMYHPLAALVLGYLFLLALTNQPDYLKTLIQKKSQRLAHLFSFRFIAVLFLVVWIFKLLFIYYPA